MCGTLSNNDGEDSLQKIFLSKYRFIGFGKIANNLPFRCFVFLLVPRKKAGCIFVRKFVFRLGVPTILTGVPDALINPCRQR